MKPPVTALDQLLALMAPRLHEGVYVFATLPPGEELAGPGIIATMREAEGLTVVLEEGLARAKGLTPIYRAAWITLEVHSDLQAIGFTAAFAAALGEAGISCNVIAGAHHDHVFVPVDATREALSALHALARSARMLEGPSR